MPRGAAGSLDGVGEVAPAPSHGRGHVNSGLSVGPRHADQLRVPPLGRGARGRSPRPVGMPGVGRCHEDLDPLAEQRGGGLPPLGTARPMAMLPAESGPLSPPAGAGRGPGPPRRGPVPPFRHVLGGPRCPHGSQPKGPAGPRELPLSGAAAPTAQQPLPLVRLRWPCAGGRQPRLRLGTPPDRRWPQDFIHDLVRWALALAWMPGPAKVSLAELAPDCEAFMGRALPASRDHRVRGMRLQLGERAQIVRKAMGLAERNLLAGTLPSGAPLPLAPPRWGPRVRGTFGWAVLRGAQRSYAAANAPRGTLPRLVGPALSGACPHAVAAE